MALCESKRAAGIQSPIIPVVAEMIRNSPGTISLGQGVVWYPPPPGAFDKIRDFAADSENNKYKAVQGIEPLKEILRTKLLAENGIAPSANNAVVVTAGGNLAFLTALLAIADPGDEVILPTPYYFNHEMAIVMIGAKPVLAPTDREYQLDVEQIERLVTTRTRAIVTVSPNNPTGAVYSAEALRSINECCRRRGLYHISDEAYEYFTYDGASHFSPGSIEGSSEHTISLYSLSKAYGFASWRIGYMAVPAHLLPAINKIQDTILICPPVISQFAAMGALTEGRRYCEEGLRSIREVREICLRELKTLEGVCDVPASRGAFYFLLRFRTAADPLKTVERLIFEHKVAAIPGTAFGIAEGSHLRVAYGALKKDTASEGVRRLVQGLQQILSS